MAGSTSETPVLDLLASMTADSLEASNLDPETLVLVRIAALVAVGAPPVSYGLNLEAAGDVGIDAEQVRGVLAAIAPIVGTARVAAATGNIVRALAVAIEIADEEAQDEESAPAPPAPRRPVGGGGAPHDRSTCTRVALIGWRDEIFAARPGGSGSSSASPSGSTSRSGGIVWPPGRSTVGHLTLRPERRSSAEGLFLARTVRVRCWCMHRSLEGGPDES